VEKEKDVVKAEPTTEVIRTDQSEVVKFLKKVGHIIWHWFFDGFRRMITVRDIFFYAMGVATTTTIGYFVWNKIMTIFIIMGQVYHDQRVWSLTEVIVKK